MKPSRKASGARAARAHAASDVKSRLRFFYRRNGYTRWQHADRVEHEGSQVYKKGDEVRLVANDADELALIRDLLVEAGFRPGRPFTRSRQYRQPLYGRESVARFLALVGASRRRRRT